MPLRHAQSAKQRAGAVGGLQQTRHQYWFPPVQCRGLLLYTQPVAEPLRMGAAPAPGELVNPQEQAAGVECPIAALGEVL
jgi:hypothetical protein